MPRIGRAKKEREEQEYQEQLARQRGRCKICCQLPKYAQKGKNKRFARDHDHKRKRQRDLLCQSCNLLLGLAKDNPHILKRARNYLIFWGWSARKRRKFTEEFERQQKKLKETGDPMTLSIPIA